MGSSASNGGRGLKPATTRRGLVRSVGSPASNGGRGLKLPARLTLCGTRRGTGRMGIVKNMIATGGFPLSASSHFGFGRHAPVPGSGATPAERTMRIASNGHRTAHSAHPAQPAASCNCARLGPHVDTPAACSDSTCGGHTATHQPQPVQRAGTMVGRALAGMGWAACGQTAASVSCRSHPLPSAHQAARRP